MKNHLKFIILAALVALAGCDKIRGLGKDQSPEAAAQPESMARAKPDAGGVATETVQATGRGKTPLSATDQALAMAIAQVNGKAVTAAAAEAGSATLDLGDVSLELGSVELQDVVRSRTQGVVKGFKVLEQDFDKKTGMTTVTIEASVTRFARPESANRLRIAVAPLRTGPASYTVGQTSIAAGEIAGKIRQNLITALTKSNRIAMLDRDFDAEVDAELDRITGGKVAKEEFARVGQQLATDYVLVGRIENFGYQRHEQPLRMSDKVLVSHSGGAMVSFRLVNVATGQIEMTDRVAISLPRTEPTTLGTSVNVRQVAGDMVAALSDNASQKIMLHLFPITIVALEGETVVLSQGGAALVEGGYYEVMARGKEITDPQTGQSLGRVESPCCVVQVTRVTPDMSYGRIASHKIDVAAAFAPGALELSGNMADPAQMQAAAPAPAAPAARKAPRPAAAPRQAAEQPAAASSDSDPNW